MKNIFALVLFLLAASPALSDENTELQNASVAYDEGRYDDAIKIYEKEVGSGPANGHLFYNLGNAYFRDGQKGKAIAALLAAKRYLPRDPDVQANLNFAKASLVDKIEGGDESPGWSVLFFWTEAFNVKEQAYAMAWLFSLACLIMLSSLLFKKMVALRWVAGFLFGASLVLGIGLGVKNSKEKPWGAVSQSLVKVYSGPNSTNTVVFELHEGSPAMVLDQDKDWYKISLADGKKGWVSAESFAVYL